MIRPEKEFFSGLKWLMFFRVIFTALLLGSTIILQFGDSSMLSKPVLMLYGLIIFVFILSFVYALFIHHVKHPGIFAYLQMGLDTFVVTIIIFVTGSFSSIFSFLYLLVIIYSSILLFRKGSLIIATLCSIQYGIMVDLEYYGFLKPFETQAGLTAVNYDWSYVFYKVVITMVACFAVALLSSFLSERERKTKKELKVMENHVKRYEKMAAIGEMAAGLAHEIKNPLASLTGSVQILREELRYDPEQEKLMQIVIREADRLSGLVSDFLLFARPPEGRVKRVELAQAVQETISLFENDKILHGRIELIRELLPDVWVEIDPMHLRQVLWNLLLNAAESISGEGIIRVGLQGQRGAYVNLYIEDTGCGISEEDIQEIFDPFYTTKPNGTGLGLSIVHSILKSYDVILDINSTEGSGTRVSLKFRRIEHRT